MSNRAVTRLRWFTYAYSHVAALTLGSIKFPPVISPFRFDGSNGMGIADAEGRKAMDEDTAMYRVLINHEEQYSIWLADRSIPKGWRDVGKQGLKSECLSYIREVWIDMRPLSLRQRMDAAP
jgi:MbtH protein